MTGVLLGGLLGAVVGAFLPRLIALIPDREQVVDTSRSSGRRAPVGADPAVPDVPAPTPYWALAAVPHLSWYLAAPTAVLWALLAAGGWDASLPAQLLVAGLGVAMAYIDIREHRLPDRLTYPAFAGAAIALAIAALMTGEWSAYGRAWAAAALLVGAFLVLALIRPGELGLGDVKLSASLGLLLGWIGWGHVVLGAFLGFAFGGIYSVVLLALRRADRRTAIPFGPFLLAGGFSAIAWGEAILEAYLG